MKTSAIRIIPPKIYNLIWMVMMPMAQLNEDLLYIFCLGIMLTFCLAEVDWNVINDEEK